MRNNSAFFRIKAECFECIGNKLFCKTCDCFIVSICTTVAALLKSWQSSAKPFINPNPLINRLRSLRHQDNLTVSLSRSCLLLQQLQASNRTLEKRYPDSRASAVRRLRRTKRDTLLETAAVIFFSSTLLMNVFFGDDEWESGLLRTISEENWTTQEPPYFSAVL